MEKTHRAFGPSFAVVLAGAAFLLVAGSHVCGDVIADSVADFGGTQGLNGWYYGYGFEGVYFAECVYLPDSQAWSSGAGRGYPYLGAWSQIPATADYNGFDAWAIRRWVSSVDGDIRITGAMQRGTWEPYGVGDGVLAAIYVDGGYLGGVSIGNWDYTVYNYDVTTTVHVGSTVDFITGPYGSMWGDGTYMTATIVPEPATMSLLMLGLSGLVLGRRRPR